MAAAASVRGHWTRPAADRRKLDSRSVATQRVVPLTRSTLADFIFVVAVVFFSFFLSFFLFLFFFFFFIF